ncbi:hypothetical protein [Arenimonas oryziterrae]|uniref:AsmA domain-containing protein n=1 Tax=Arenimonas oryziterrae DSM 21050 = YC6267 TaxID=1121015 RepID=A0A091B083_9GAMM|nr:hypothetical protein [Arenimonas oryziterrae]KFN44942.1 hypothetical protein N789_02665 [Arenimonas oryziterrae DSM 21050 = YC6267]
MALGTRGRRWLKILAVFGLVLAIGAWWVDRQLEPHRLTELVLRKAGESLKLELSYSGDPDYALKPEPRLLIPNFVVRDPVDGKVLLTAKRIEVSLPWDTLTGGAPVITRIELDKPVLDLPGLLRWQATRPKTPFELPTLTKGLHVRDGTIRHDAFTLTKLELDLPHLQTGEAAEASVAGHLVAGTTAVDLKLFLTAATPGLASDFTLSGSGSLEQQPKPLPFKLHLAGHYLSDDTAFSVTATKLDFEGASPLPNLQGKADFALGEKMKFNFDGLLRDWPEDWPALPQPIANDTKNLPLRLSYLGDTGLGDPLSLDIVQGETKMHASLRIEEMQQWVAKPDGALLPPLNATISTPTLEFDGIELEGVEIEIRDSAPPAAQP